MILGRWDIASVGILHDEGTLQSIGASNRHGDLIKQLRGVCGERAAARKFNNQALSLLDSHTIVVSACMLIPSGPHSRQNKRAIHSKET
jgi:hypothetical protein